MTPIQVVAAIIPEEDEFGNIRYLMTKRAEGKRLSGWWEYNGGRIRDGETPRQAVEREVREELGIEVLAGEGFLKINYTYLDGVEIDLLSYRCRWVSGKIKMNEVEISDYDFVLPSNMHLYPILDADQFIVEQLLKETNQKSTLSSQ